jgi:hypothetical protein
MGHRGLVVLLLGMVVLGAGGVAWYSPDVVGQGGDDWAGTSRYRVTLVRLAVPEDSTGGPLLLTEFGREVPGAILPRSRAPGLVGHFGAVPVQRDLLKVLKQRSTGMEVVFCGEMEGLLGTKCSVNSGQKFPLRSTELRGTQEFVTTRFEQIGVQVDLERKPDKGSVRDTHSVAMQLSAVTAQVDGGNCVLFQVSSKGTISLPDGYTTVFSFLDRVEGGIFANAVKGQTPALAVPPDLVAEYFLLLTRMDLM